MMIFILIAGTYTPICLNVLDKETGIPLLGLVWLIAAVGIIIKAFFVYCPKWFSSLLYIGMGWLCVLVFSRLLNEMSNEAFGWLLAGGIIWREVSVILF